MKFLYLGVIFLTILIPAILSHHKDLKLYRRWKAMLKAILIPSVFFWLWDIGATYRGHWSFNAHFVLGITIVNLPLEEYLFFLVLGFVSIFTYEVVKLKMGKRTGGRPIG